VKIRIAVVSLLLAGCGGGGSAHSAAVRVRPSVPLRRRAIPTVRCGARPAVGQVLRLPGAAVLSVPGAPDGIASTSDGGAAFVALQSGPPRIAVIERAGSSERLVRDVSVPAYARGVHVTPDGKYVLAAAGRGAVVLDAASAMSGNGQAVLGSLATPAGVAGGGPGAAEVAVSRDSRYAFVTLEGAGVVAVFDLRAALGSGLGGSGLRGGGFVGSIPVGAGALGIVPSPDGRWLYEVSESARGGVLNVINLARAVRDPASSVVATAPAPCAPVRVAVSADGAIVWVTSRDANSLLGYSASALRTDPRHALISVTRVGSQPLALALVRGGNTVLVVDSNLSNSRRARSGVSVVDIASPARPRLLGTIPSGKFTHEISAPAAGGVALVTNSDSRQVDTIPLSQLP
jgi:hypothetical protein